MCFMFENNFAETSNLTSRKSTCVRPGTIHLTHDSIRFDYYTCNSI